MREWNYAGVMTGSAIQFRQLTKARGEQVVLSKLDLDVLEGEFLGLIGVNGAGKTTLIKCLLDLDSVSSGSIAIFGQEHCVAGAREQLAYLPEKFLPPCYLTGQDFLRYMSKLHGHDFNPGEVEEMLHILDLEAAALDKSAGRLSRGMAQKLGLAACLLSGKRLLVMDEPMSGLDPKARAGLKHRLLELKQQGHTFFFSAHLLADAEKLCDRIAILHQGKIQYIGSPAACCRHFNAPDLEQAYLCCIGAEPSRMSNGRRKSQAC